jgi:hypothetical protein
MNAKLTLLCISMCCLTAVSVKGQWVGSITATINKQKIELGEPFQLSVQYRYPAGLPINDLPPTTIPHFEIIQSAIIDSVTANGFTAVHKRVTLTSFDSGQWVIPAFSLSKKIQSKPMMVEVVFHHFNIAQPYHDIKDIETITTDTKHSNWRYIVVALMFILLLGIYVFRKRKKATTIPIETVDAFELAMRQLEALPKQPISKKEFYTALEFIFKNYIAKRKGVAALQTTTEQLLQYLKYTGWLSTQYDALAQLLTTCDWVKFAKHQTTEVEDQQAIHIMTHAIKTVHNNQ